MQHRLISVRDAHVIQEVEQAKARLNDLWDELKLPEDERNYARPEREGYNDFEEDGEVPEAELELRALKKQIGLVESHLVAIKPILSLIEKRESLQKEKVCTVVLQYRRLT